MIFFTQIFFLLNKLKVPAGGKRKARFKEEFCENLTAKKISVRIFFAEAGLAAIT